MCFRPSTRCTLLPLLVAGLIFIRDVVSVGKPFGFGAGVTGGGNLTPTSPGDIRTLQAWLADNKPRVILIDKVYDFSDVEGNTTGPGCTVWPSCSNGRQVQSALNYRGWCGQQAGSKSITVNYRKAALTPLVVGSNKSILGRGPSAVIRGKGLVINYPAKNVIIHGITITFLNPDKVWGGDGIILNGAKDVWIDHCTFNLIGRQMIVAEGHLPNTGITISHNKFDGKTAWSFDCSNQHYWTILFGGISDQVTIARNCFNSVSGRAPRVYSKKSGSSTLIHHYNNYHFASRGQVMEIEEASKILVEGNVLENVGPAGKKQAQSMFADGKIFAAFTPQEASLCNGPLGRPCVLNQMSKISGKAGPTLFGTEVGVLNSMKSIQAVTQAPIEPATVVSSRKFQTCGAGAL